MKTYTIEQIKKYLEKSDSLGNVLYFCDEEHLDDAQIDIEETSEEDDPEENEGE